MILHHETCPGKPYIEPYQPEHLPPDERAVKRAKIYSQCRELGVETKITCICERKIGAIHMFRCFYCDLWLCPRCAKEHFGVPQDFVRHGW